MYYVPPFAPLPSPALAPFSGPPRAQELCRGRPASHRARSMGCKARSVWVLSAHQPPVRGKPIRGSRPQRKPSDDPPRCRSLSGRGATPDAERSERSYDGPGTQGLKASGSAKERRGRGGVETVQTGTIPRRDGGKRKGPVLGACGSLRQLAAACAA